MSDVRLSGRGRIPPHATILVLVMSMSIGCGASQLASSASGAASSRSSTEPAQDRAREPLVHVEDPSGKLTTEDRSALISRLEQVGSKSKVKLGAIIVPSLNGDSIEQLGERTFRGWELGERGILLVIVIEERQARIETGRAIEAIVPDDLAHAVLVRHLNPHLRAEDFAGGLDETFGALLALLQDRE